MKLEADQQASCYQLGGDGYAITMLIHTLTELMKTNFNEDLGAFEASVDGNLGCLPIEVENALQ